MLETQLIISSSERRTARLAEIKNKKFAKPLRKTRTHLHRAVLFTSSWCAFDLRSSGVIYTRGKGARTDHLPGLGLIEFDP